MDWSTVSCLLRCAVGDLTQDDDTSTLTGPDLLSTWSHLDHRQSCQPVREDNISGQKQTTLDGPTESLSCV